MNEMEANMKTERTVETLSVDSLAGKGTTVLESKRPCLIWATGCKNAVGRAGQMGDSSTGHW